MSVPHLLLFSLICTISAQQFRRVELPPINELLAHDTKSESPHHSRPLVMRPTASSGTPTEASNYERLRADVERYQSMPSDVRYIDDLVSQSQSQYQQQNQQQQRNSWYEEEYGALPTPRQSALRPSIGHDLTAIPGMIASPTPRSTTTTAPVVDNSYAINYCDKREFPDELLSQYSLERIEYFIFNTSCSDIFFQCSIGQTFLLKCSSPDQAFDRATVNCNYRNDVRECPEYDHVMHCTIQESCTENQFACCAQPQMCIDLARRCDGHIDCADGEDENNCPSCKTDEFACVKSGRCISAALRCDGVLDDCGDGSNLDEVGCSRNSTCLGKFVCDSNLSKSVMGSHNCVEYIKHCDGVRDCPSGEDEINCKMTEAKYLLCENQKQSVTKQQWCDGNEDCSDASDEKYCYKK